MVASLARRAAAETARALLRKGNASQARDVLKTAVQAGDSDAAAVLGLWMLERRVPASEETSLLGAVPLLEQAAADGVPLAQYELGWRLRIGDGANSVMRDRDRGLALLASAAQAAEPRAAYTLAVDAVHREAYDEAVQHLETTLHIQQTHPEACVALGAILARGFSSRGTDISRARRLFAAAESAGSVLAKAWIAAVDEKEEQDRHDQGRGARGDV